MATRRWLQNEGVHGELSDVDAFLAEIVEVSKRHGMQISHEDCHGAFEVDRYDGSTDEWVMAAHWIGPKRRSAAKPE